MNEDAELETWRRQWRVPSNPPSVAEITRRVKRQSQQLRVAMIAPVIVSLVIGGYVLLIAARSRDLKNMALAYEVWIFIAVTWVVCLRMTRGNWRPSSNTTAAFVELAVARCESSLRTVPFGFGLYVVELVFLLLWKRWVSAIGWRLLATSWPTVVLLWCGVPTLFSACLWYRHARRLELRYLLQLQRQLTEPEFPAVRTGS